MSRKSDRIGGRYLRRDVRACEAGAVARILEGRGPLRLARAVAEALGVLAVAPGHAAGDAVIERTAIVVDAAALPACRVGIDRALDRQPAGGGVGERRRFLRRRGAAGAADQDVRIAGEQVRGGIGLYAVAIVRGRSPQRRGVVALLAGAVEIDRRLIPDVRVVINAVEIRAVVGRVAVTADRQAGAGVLAHRVGGIEAGAHVVGHEIPAHAAGIVENEQQVRFHHGIGRGGEWSGCDGHLGMRARDAEACHGDECRQRQPAFGPSENSVGIHRELPFFAGIRPRLLNIRIPERSSWCSSALRPSR